MGYICPLTNALRRFLGGYLNQEHLDAPGTLLSLTRAMLQEDQRDLLTIHKESGLPFYWLKDMKAGRIKSPSVNRVQRLYEFYSSKPLLTTV
jgi:hypothetical protein